MESSAEFAKNLNRGAFLQLIKAAQIVPFANEKFKMIEEPAEEESSQEMGGGMRSIMDKERNGKRKGQRDCAELTGIVERMADIRGIPFALHDSFIYNVPEVQRSIHSINWLIFIIYYRNSNPFYLHCPYWSFPKNNLDNAKLNSSRWWLPKTKSRWLKRHSSANCCQRGGATRRQGEQEGRETTNW